MSFFSVPGKKPVLSYLKEVGKACLFKNIVLLSYLLISKHLLKFQYTIKSTGKHRKMMVLYSSITQSETYSLEVPGLGPELIIDLAVGSLDLCSKKSLKSL